MSTPCERPELSATPIDSVAQLKSTQLGYWDTQGSGSVVILMHSGAQSALAWGHQKRPLRQAGYRVIGYSRRGYAGSGGLNPSDTAEADPGIASQDLLDLMDYLQIKKAHLVALAHGGYFALDFALSCPQRVISLTVASSMMGITDPHYLQMQARLRPPFFESLPMDFKELGPAYRASDPLGLAAWNQLAKKARTTTVESVTHASASTLAANPGVRNRICGSTLNTLKLPVLLMTGDADLYVPPPVLRYQASLIKGAKSLLIDESGHCPNWEQPERFNQHLIKFLRQHDVP